MTEIRKTNYLRSLTDEIQQKIDAVEGTVEGTIERITDLEATVDTETTGLVDKVAALEGYLSVSPIGIEVPSTGAFDFLSSDETYTYDSTPDDPAPDPAHEIDMPSDATEAAITPGGATAHALTFNLPGTKTVPVFKVTFTAGTHTGDVKISGLVGSDVTLSATGGPGGDGVYYFIWDEGEEGWVESDDDATIQLSGVFLAAEAPQVLQPGAGKTLTIALPTEKTEDFLYVLYDTSSSASGDTVIGGVTVDDGSGAAGVLPFWWDEDSGAYVSLTSADPMYTIPDNTPLVYIEIEDGNSDNTYKVKLPDGSTHVREIIAISAELTASAGTAATIDVYGPETPDSDISGGHLYYHLASGVWLPLSDLYAATDHTHE